MDTLGGHDQLILDTSILAAGRSVRMDAGGQASSLGDTLMIAGPGVASADYQASGPGQGTLVVDGQLVQFTGVEPLRIVPASLGTLDVRTTDGQPHLIRITDDGAANGVSQVLLDGGLSSVSFTHPSSALSVSGGAANDILVLEQVDSAAGAVVTLRGQGGKGATM